jgi:predicted N-acyltransferase
LGTPVYSKNFFRNILQERGDQAHIVIVYWRNRPVSAAFLLGYRDMMEIPWASTVREANSLNINMLLYRTVLGFCIRKHYQFFDFGRSSKDSGTYRFKKQWGARPVQHYWHYWLESGGALPELKPDSPKFRILIACWRKLPIWITKVIGPMIVKSLP